MNRQLAHAAAKGLSAIITAVAMAAGYIVLALVFLVFCIGTAIALVLGLGRVKA